MIVVFIILCILGYILIAGVVNIIYRHMFKDSSDVLFASVLWPVTFPIVIVYVIFMLLSAAVRWTGRWIEELFQPVKIEEDSN